mgnify:CR=1 FL=1
MPKRSVEDRREQALRMQEERATRSSAQQIERLDKMFGKGKGAKKERARLERPSKAKE